MAAGRAGPVAIGVSGGSDSTALLHLADRWVRQANRELLILSVDHGLRPEATDEVRYVVETARSMGHAAQRLTWKPDKASQQAARKARHGLIARAAREAGAELVLLGHTRTDLEETLLMRLARPTTLVGAVGPQAMSVSPVWPEGRGLLLGRPLLGISRETLRDWLRAQRIRWIDDPSNEAEVYERVRLRKLIARLGPDRLHRITADAIRLRAAEDADLASHLDQIRVDRSGLIEMQHLPPTPRLQYRLLSLLLQVAAGSDRPGDAKALEAACRDIASGGPTSRLTLGGAWLQRRSGSLLIGRDPGEVCARWQGTVWDGRYEYAPGTSPPDEAPFLVRHAVPAGADWREILSARLRHWKEALALGAAYSAELAGNSAAPATTHPG